MIKLCRTLGRDQQAATAIEYALIAALIAVGIIGTVTAIGAEVLKPFDTAGTTIADANS